MYFRCMSADVPDSTAATYKMCTIQPASSPKNDVVKGNLFYIK